MRTVFLLLLLVNLALAGWWSYMHYYASARPHRLIASTDQTGETSSLRLLQELPANERFSIIKERLDSAHVERDVVAGGISSDGIEDAPVENTYCFRVVGIVRKEQRDALVDGITTDHMTILDRGEEFTERKVYWVHIPSLKSFTAANNVASALAKAKVRDYFLIREGETKNGISLGLFTQKEGAYKRQQEIAKLQLIAPRPEIRERVSTVRHYWLTVKQQGGQDGELQRLLQSNNAAGTPFECPP